MATREEEFDDDDVQEVNAQGDRRKRFFSKERKFRTLYF